DQRPGDGDPELLPRGARVAAHLHDAAEEEEVDPADRDALATCGERMAELVQEDRSEEAERGGDRGPERERGVAELVLKGVVQPEDEEEQDSEPRDVDADADAEDGRQASGAATDHAASMVA